MDMQGPPILFYAEIVELRGKKGKFENVALQFTAYCTSVDSFTCQSSLPTCQFPQDANGHFILIIKKPDVYEV